MGSYTPEDLDITLWAELDEIETGPSQDSSKEIAREQVANAIEKFNRLTGRGLLDDEGKPQRLHGGNTRCPDESNVFPQIKKVAETEVLVVHHDLGATASRFTIFPDTGTVKEEHFDRGPDRYTEPITLDGAPVPLEQARIAAKLQGILQQAIQASMTERLVGGTEL